MVKVGISGVDTTDFPFYISWHVDGTTRDDGSQQSLLVSAADLPRGAGHPFYERLNRILEAAGFDAFVERVCARFYTTMGRPSLAPGRYFRLLLLGYFEGLDSERAIAWRASDSLSVRAFLRLALPASPPDHSTISRTRRLFSVEAHQAVFRWVLQQLAESSLVTGKTLGIDATTLEANAALVNVAGLNLGLLLRQQIGVGTPRGLQGRAVSRRLGADRAAGGHVERSETALDAIAAPCGADRRAIAPPAPSTSHLKTEDFYLGLWRRTRRCGASCGVTRGRTTRRS